MYSARTAVAASAPVNAGFQTRTADGGSLFMNGLPRHQTPGCRLFTSLSPDVLRGRLC